MDDPISCPGKGAKPLRNEEASHLAPLHIKPKRVQLDRGFYPSLDER
jgi:hypothetical protein